MTDRPTWLVWLDLETTGSDEDVDRILEIGFVITDEALNEKSAYQYVVRQDDGKNWRLASDGVVRDMHDKNGLWDAVADPEAPRLWCVELGAIADLKELGDKHDFVLCGSGVSHFDRRFLPRRCRTSPSGSATTPSTWASCAALLS
jgi:oligoribonuclease (3'-5' exoribonuclease)